MWRGKENGKDGYLYMVDILEDGTPQWQDEDLDDDHADYG